MRVGLFGFGRAGKAVASVLLRSRDTQLCWVMRKSKIFQHKSVSEFLGVSSDDPGLIFSKSEWTAAALFEHHPVDVVIDFSSANSIGFYGNEAAGRNVAIVSAVSEYPPKILKRIQALASKTRVLWSPNITIGINFLMLAARVLRNIAPYSDVEIIEEHFKDKREVSGTAKRIATFLEMDEASIKTIRAGGIVGCHEILFGFPFQTVRLKHESISREAFGNGALFAAKSILKVKNGLYSMEDILLPYFKVRTLKSCS